VSPKPHSNLNLSAREPYVGRYTTIALRINVTTDVDCFLVGKTGAPDAFASLPYASTDYLPETQPPCGGIAQSGDKLGITCKFVSLPQPARGHADAAFGLSQPLRYAHTRSDIRAPFTDLRPIRA
jgi:hypothetical protein